MLKKVNNQSLKIGEILCDNGLLSASLLQSVLEEQKSDSRKLGELLIEKGIVVESQVLTILSAMHNLPYISLENIHFDDQVFGLVSVALLRKHKIVPLGIEEGCLKVAINNCLDVLALQEIQDISGYPLKVSLASLLDIEKCLDKYEVSIHARKRDIKPKGVSDEDTPIIHCVETLIAQAINNRASDIHFEPAKDKMYVRFRIDGHLYSKTPIPKAIENKVLSRIKIIAGMDVANSREPQDGRLTIEKFKNYDIRVSTLPGILGENMVLRILDKTFTDFSFSSLGMSSPEEKIIKDLSAKPYGMLLVTGPTGAGKTTTLYAMLNYVKDVSKNIITVEDPVEYQV
ncbi:Type IV fimbrial assembly, ATPase PilB, partial [hydrothermal vent metagenome]